MTEPSTDGLREGRANSDIRRRTGRDTLAAAGVLLLVLVALNSDVIFAGRSVVLTNLYNPVDSRPLPQNYGPGMVPHETWTARNLWTTPRIRDPGATWWQWEPGRVFLRDAIESREWPWWDPYVAAGTPAMANLIPAFFFPPYTLIIAAGGSVGLFNAYWLGLLWASSFLAFLFLRRHELTFAASLGGGIFVMTSGALQQELGSFIGQTLACFPLVLYATRAFLDQPTWRRAAWVSSTYAFASLASFPPMLLAVFGAVVLYVAVAIATGDGGGSRRETAGKWVAAAVVGVGLVAWYYLPAIALRQAVPHLMAAYRGAGLESMPSTNLLQLLSPTAFGGVQIYLRGPFTGSPGMHLAYLGAVAALAALLSRPTGRGPGRTLFLTCAIGATAILLKLFGVPPIQWIGRLPFFDQIHFAHYFGSVAVLMLACLGAMGLDRIQRRGVSTLSLALAVAAMFAAIEAIWWLAGAAVNRPDAAHWIRDWKVLGALSASAAAVVALTGIVPPARTATVVYGLIGLAVLEGIYNGWYPRPKAWDVFASPPDYVAALQAEAGAGRVFSVNAPVANTNEPFGVATLDSLMPFNPPRVYELYRRYAGSPPTVFMREASTLPPDPVLDRAGIGVVSIADSLPSIVKAASDRGYERRFADGYVSVFRRPPVERFRFSSAYRVLPRAEALDAIGLPDRGEIILEDSPGFDSAPGGPKDHTLVVDSYRRNSAQITVHAPRAGLLYAAESFFDGWTATVNGNPAPILPANYAFRAVAVPAGTSTVVLSYWPPGLTAGLWLSAASLVAALTMALVPVRRQRLGSPAAGS